MGYKVDLSKIDKENKTKQKANEVARIKMYEVAPMMALIEDNKPLLVDFIDKQVSEHPEYVAVYIYTVIAQPILVGNQ